MLYSALSQFAKVGLTKFEDYVSIQTIEEGLALFGLDILHTDQIPKLALLFLADGGDVSEMAALAGSLPIDHPADRRADLRRALHLTGRVVPTRIEAAHILKRIYAHRGSSGTLSPRDAARQIKDIFQTVEADLPKPRAYVGDSFGIADLIGLYYSYDDILFNDLQAARAIDSELLAELARLANE